jgi:CRP-like cAMP-binding protein
VTEYPLLKQLSLRGSITREESEFLTAAFSGTREIPHDREFIREGDVPQASTVLLSGFAARSRELSDGKRQFLTIHVEGDFVDLHSFLLKKMDHGVVALTRCTVASVPHERLKEITERFPNLTRQLWLSTLIDAAIHREWLVSFGRRSSRANVAHLLCELYMRLAAVGKADKFQFRLPITQGELADARGMSIVHLNRAIKGLRELDLITWLGETVEIKDWNGLASLADFDPNYLKLDMRRLAPLE